MALLIPEWMLKYREFIAYNDLPVVFGGLGPLNDPQPADTVDFILRYWWNYDDVDTLLNEERILNDLHAQGALIPNHGMWQQFYDELLHYKTANAPAG